MSKLNYRLEFKDHFEPKTKTKISMQSVVSSVLASKLPQNPVAQPTAGQQDTGWGRNK